MMHQPFDYEPTPGTVDLDGHVDRRGVRYIGKARRGANGLYTCLADVEGCLCWVEMSLTLLERGSS